MRATFIARILDDAGELLAWSRVEAEARPQDRAASCPFFALEATRFEAERSGLASRIAVHWPDLDVARVQDLLERVQVETGQVFAFGWLEPVWLVPGMRDVPLPAVTERRSVVVSPPTGNLAAAASQ